MPTPPPNLVEFENACKVALRLILQAAALLQQQLGDEGNQRINLLFDVDADDIGRRVTKDSSDAPVNEKDSSQNARLRRRDIFNEFERFQQFFTEPQWVAVTLYYRDGLGDKEVGERLSISERAAYDRRRRAERVKARLERELREEQFRLIRKYEKS